MSRTQGRLSNDLAQPDGQFFFSALDGTSTTTTGTATPTRNALGSYSLNLANSSSVVLTIPLSSILQRYGVQDYVQEFYGSSAYGGAQGFATGGYTTNSTASTVAGNLVSIPVLSSAGFDAGKTVLVDSVASTRQESAIIVSVPDATHIVVNALANPHTTPFVVTQSLFTTPAGVSGPPPFSGVSQFTSPVSRPKGLLIKQIYPAYSILTANATANTIGLTKTVFQNVTAPAVTAMLTNANNGLSTVFNAQPFLTPVTIPIANQGYLATKYTSAYIEWDVTTGAGGTADLFGVFVDVSFNYN